MQKSVQDLQQEMVKVLHDQYDPQEGSQVSFLILEDVLGITKQDLMLNKILNIEPHQQSQLDQNIDLLKQNVPVQYILGHAFFYGREFKVDPKVLIPRPETEELVHWVVEDQEARGLKVLDVGTGSGCIAITLALELDAPKVWALDNQQPALRVAQANSTIYQVPVNFILLDIISNKPSIRGFDVIISNPPYVPISERHALNLRVKDFEPEAALFVTDEQPLLYYHRLAEIGPELIKSGGSLYLEIPHNTGAEVLKLFQVSPWAAAEFSQDIHGRDRMVKVTLR